MDAVSVASATTWTTANAAVQETLCDLVGHVGSREAVTIVAAIVDTHPCMVFTPADLSGLIRDATHGYEVWKPITQVVDNYCRYALTSGVVVEPVTVASTSRWMLGQPARAYQSRGTRTARTWRLRVYDALAGWGLRHPAASVQQVIGPPRGGGGGRPTPAHLRLPMYEVLLRTPGQFVDRRDLHRQMTDVVASDRVAESWLQQTIQVLATNKILANRPGKRDVAIAPSWIEPIRDLLSSLTAVHRSNGDDQSRRLCEPESQVLSSPDAIAALLDKTERWSSSIIGQRQGATVTSADIYEIIRSRPDPMSASDIADTLTRAGRPITPSRVHAYLRTLVKASKIAALPGAGRTEPGIRGSGPHGYTATPIRSAERAARGQQPALE